MIHLFCEYVYSVFDFNEKEGIYQKIFTTKDLQQRYNLSTETRTENLPHQKREGLRNRRISYVEIDQNVWGVGYDDDLGR